MSLLVGILGMLCMLIAFVLDEFVKKFNQNTVAYNMLNLLGAGLLVYYGLTLRGWPFVILNAIWCAVAGIKLVEIVKRRR